LKICYSKPQEHRQDFFDCECDEQTIGYYSNIDKPYASADTKVKSNQLNDRQSQVIKNTNFSVDRIICMSSETKISEQAEEQEVSSYSFSLINFSPCHYRNLENISYHHNINVH
jgi:hypothetical protein